ncbi:hypothetical protein Tco_1503646 [Tanacetum coccineum]
MVLRFLVFNPFVEIPFDENKVHIKVLSVLWGNRLPIPDGLLSLSSDDVACGGPQRHVAVALTYMQKPAKPPTADRDWNKTLPDAHGRVQPWLSSLACMEDPCRQVIPFDHFINKDLAYLSGGVSSRKYTTSVTKTKAADYGHITWIEELVPNTLESARDVYSKRRIIAVTNLQIVEWHNYKHLDWITIRRDDDKLYKFKEGDFNRLRIQDIKDMLLLLVQGKLKNLTVEERLDFNVSLRIFTRSFVIQRRVEDLQLGNSNEVSTTDYLESGDRDKAGAMIQEIDKQLKTRRIMRSLVKFIGQTLFNTTAGNPIKKILLKLNLYDHRSILTDSKLQALVDGKKIAVTKASVRRDLQLDDEEGTDCLPNATIFEELTRMGYEKLLQKLTFYKAFFFPQWKFLIHTILQCLSAKTTTWNEFSSTMDSAIICLATNQKFNFSMYIFESMVKNLDNADKFLMYPRRPKEKETQVPQFSVPSDPINVADKAVNDEPSMQLKEMMDFYTKLQQRVLDLENTKTTKSQEITSLKKRFKKLEKKGGSRTHKLKRLYKVSRSVKIVSSDEASLGDQEDASKQGRKIHDIDADEDVTLENVHDAKIFDVNDLHGDEVVSLKYLVEQIPEFRDILIQHMESVKKSIDKRALHKREYDIRKLGKQDTSSSSGNDVDADDAYIKPVYNEEPMAEVQLTAECNVFTTGQQHSEQPKFNNDGEVDQNAEQCTLNLSAEVFVEKEVLVKEVSVVGKVNTASIVTIVSAATITKDKITLAQALAELKSVKPKVTTATTATTKGILLQEPSESITTTTTTIPSKDKGKCIMVEEPLQMKKKDQISFDKQEAIRLQAEFDEEIEADQLLAERLQVREQEELTIEERDKLFQQLLEKRRNHFAAKRAEEKRNMPPTRAQQRSIMCTYLKNMAGWKPKDLKSKSFENIPELFDKAFKSVNTFVDFRIELVDGTEMEESSKKAEVMEESSKKAKENSSKRTGDELEQENAKKQKVDENSKHGYTKPEEGYERVLWGDLKTMFEHHVEYAVWRNRRENKVLVWKLFDSCGVQFVRFQNLHVFMLVEKRYPLTPATITDMLNKKLQADHWNEMCYEVLKLITKQLKNQ